MYQAKATPSGWNMYAFEPGERGRGRLQTIEDLRTAIEGDQLVLHYQPKVHASDGAVAAWKRSPAGATPIRECCTRTPSCPWPSKLGSCEPSRQRCCAPRSSRPQAGAKPGLPVSVAVNLSVANLIDTNLPVEVGSLLTSFRPPRRRTRVGDHREHADGRSSPQPGHHRRPARTWCTDRCGRLWHRAALSWRTCNGLPSTS
jgi:hypothetical protein